MIISQCKYLCVFVLRLLGLVIAICSPVWGQVDAVNQSSSGREILAHELITQALANNAELASARLEIERAQALLKQAGLKPNPTLDFEQTTGKLTNSRNEGSISLGFSLPIELGGKRQRRIDLAQLELSIAEAEVADRERKFAAEILAIYTEALGIQQELKIMEQLNNVDAQTIDIVEIRVKEGDAAPLEMNLLKVEREKLKSRHTLVAGRLQAVLIKLKSLAGIDLSEPLQLKESLLTPTLTQQPYSLVEALEIAQQNRPDLKVAKLTEQSAQASLQLAKTQAQPDLVLSTKYSHQQSAFDNTPVGLIKDSDNLLTLGISINLPVRNRNQGNIASVTVSVAQAQKRREFLETSIRAEILAGYARYQAAQQAVREFEQGVLNQSIENLRTLTQVYNLGEFRITELIAEQRRLLDSQREYTELLMARYQALSNIALSMGMLKLNKEQK